MDDVERQAIVEQMKAEIWPLIDKPNYQGGYNCCGCSTYVYIFEHAVAIVEGREYTSPGWP